MKKKLGHATKHGFLMLSQFRELSATFSEVSSLKIRCIYKKITICDSAMTNRVEFDTGETGLRAVLKDYQEFALRALDCP